MSQEATAYLNRHVRDVTLAQRGILGIFADLCNKHGRTRVTLTTVAEIAGRTRRQVERHVRALREVKHLARQGRTWLLPGLADHSLGGCTHPWCMKQYQAGCRPKTARPRRRLSWAEMVTERPPTLVSAFMDAARALSDIRPRRRHGHADHETADPHPPP